MFSSGPYFQEFLEGQNLDLDSSIRLKNDTLKILNRTGLDFEGESASAQLVVGQVQSGKTMSFTGLIASARDNGFPLVVLVAGTKKSLFQQTVKRLRKDLKIDGDGGANPWKLIEKPDESHLQVISDSMHGWSDPTTPLDFKRTTILVVLKSKAGIEKVASLFESMQKLKLTEKAKILIIDDEADQASLNTQVKTKEPNNAEKKSAIYAALTRLRNATPKHSFVMYTATPQAPLLLSLQDHLSPSSVTVLSPGPDYVGGAELFSEQSEFSVEIPENEISLALESETYEGAPRSLRESLAYFLIALTVAQKRANPKPLSMMIHPSSSVDLHERFLKWTKSVLDEWKVSLADQSEDIFSYTVERDFLPVLETMKDRVNFPKEWSNVFNDSLEFQEILNKYTRHWISQIETKVVNKDNQDIDPTMWKSFAGWILIGGNKLERGFTVENLAVTYMPRGSGVGNADVIQQRARFFGYKRKYLDILRAWLSKETILNYVNYVEHENEMRRQLIEIDNSGSALQDWRRKFLLDKSMKICRSQVQSLPVAHEKLSSGFVFKQSQLFFDRLEENKFAVTNFLKEFSIDDDFEDDKRVDRKCKFVEVDSEVVLNLLADWAASPSEREQIDRLMFAVSLIADQGVEIKSRVVLMDVDNNSNQLSRFRSVSQDAESRGSIDKGNWRIKNLFQGKNPKTGDLIYPGDDQVRFNDSITVQIHKVIPQADGNEFSEVFAVAVSLPDGVSTGIVWEIG